jgi:actin related protein 2/3 complex subunit 1A/1B
VGSGAKAVPVCYYEEANNFWVSKMIKEHASTVCAVAWHPSAPVVATASTDFRCRVFSAFLKNLDPKDSTTPWGPAAKFGTLLYTFEAHGWVLDVAFSADGGTLALCAQNSSVSFIDVAAAASGSATAAQTLRLSELPLTKLLFLADGTLVGAGHCFSPLVFRRANGVWLLPGKLLPSKSLQKEESGISATRRMFQSHASTGRTESADTSAALETVHQFPVCGLQHFNSTIAGSPAEFTSSALDGKIVGWSSDELAGAMQAMSVS